MYGLLLNGEIFDVTERVVGTDMRVAEIAVKAYVTDTKGRPAECYYDLRVSPDQVREGLHNTYRTLKGQVVFIPVSTSIYEGKKAIQQYQLGGLPVKLQPLQIQPAQKVG